MWVEVIQLLYATGVDSDGSKIQKGVRNGEEFSAAISNEKVLT